MVFLHGGWIGSMYLNLFLEAIMQNYMKSHEIEHDLTYSYLTLRKAVGWVGILLSPLLFLGNILIFKDNRIPGSISLYYFTGMRDLLVGGICAIALFMFFYRGYDRWDRWATNLVGFFAVCVAFFPTTENGPLNLSGKIHFLSASAFFILLAGISLFLFTRSRSYNTGKKAVRNKIYILCGIVMLICLVAIAIYFQLYDMEYTGSSFVFWTETAALVAFGISWLTKGGTILPDTRINSANPVPEGR